MFFGIQSSKDWKSLDKISKGWSKDEKYIITTKDNEKLLLRISDISEFQAKQKEFKMIKNFLHLDLTCPNLLNLAYVTIIKMFILFYLGWKGKI